MSDIHTLLSVSATTQERAFELAPAAMMERIDLPIYHLWNPNLCPAHLLPWLAWAFSVETWNSEWSEATRRKVIASSIAVHRRKGTVGAVKRALASLGYDIDLREWFEAEGDPHTFALRVSVDGNNSGRVEIGPELFAEIRAVVDAAKPVRSHYEITADISIDAEGFSGAYPHTAIRAEAPADIPPAPILSSAARAGIVPTTRIRVEIGG